MKTLYIMRHAKSSWGEPGMEDFDRPLLEKGKKRTRTIIDFLLKKDARVDLIIASPAVRALETAKIMIHGLRVEEEQLRIEKSLYAAEKERYYDIFYDLPASVDNLMIIGHNPAISNFINDFLDEKTDPVPTSGIACFEFNTDDWTQISTADNRVVFLMYPKMLD